MRERSFLIKCKSTEKAAKIGAFFEGKHLCLKTANPKETSKGRLISHLKYDSNFKASVSL